MPFVPLGAEAAPEIPVEDSRSEASVEDPLSEASVADAEPETAVADPLPRPPYRFLLRQSSPTIFPQPWTLPSSTSLNRTQPPTSNRSERPACSRLSRPWTRCRRLRIGQELPIGVGARQAQVWPWW